MADDLAAHQPSIAARVPPSSVRFSTRAYIFTASASPSVVASTRAALAIMRAEPQLQRRLWTNAERLHAGLRELGLQVGPQPGPVVAVLLDDRDTALGAWQRLLDAGVYVNLVVPPASPTGASLLRCSLSAAHSDAQIGRIIAAFADHVAGAP